MNKKKIQNEATRNELEILSQSPSGASAASVWQKTLSLRSAAFSRRRVGFFVSCAGSFASGANRVSTPGNVGRKKGACSGAFGGSFGLFRC